MDRFYYRSFRIYVKLGMLIPVSVRYNLELDDFWQLYMKLAATPLEVSMELKDGEVQFNNPILVF